jgi:hypothetical protein
MMSLNFKYFLFPITLLIIKYKPHFFILNFILLFINLFIFIIYISQILTFKFIDTLSILE